MWAFSKLGLSKHTLLLAAAAAAGPRAPRSDLLTYLLTDLLTYLLTYLLTFLLY